MMAMVMAAMAACDSIPITMCVVSAEMALQAPRASYPVGVVAALFTAAAVGHT